MLLRLDGTEGRNPFDPRDGPEAVAGRLAPLVDKGLRIRPPQGEIRHGCGFAGFGRVSFAG